MKKLLLLPVLLGIVIFTSCKKDYTCTCTTTIDVPMFGTMTTTEPSPISKSTKRQAKTACESAEKSLKTEFGTQAVVSCKLD